MTFEVRWLGVASIDGNVRFRVGRSGANLVAEWLDRARLVASADGSQHELTFLPGVEEAERRKLERGTARVLLRHLQGHLAFHGSAVLHGRSGLAFLGASGQGKSTLAAALCASGHTLIADDAVAIAFDSERASVFPTDVEHWLDRDARELLAENHFPGFDDKLPVPARLTLAHPVVLGGLVDLVWTTTDAPSLRRVQGIDALARVLPHVVRFVLDSREHQRRELEQLETLVTKVPVWILGRPRRFDALQATLEVLADLDAKGMEHGR